MCGIAGFYGFRDDKLIKKISHELEHRGPDGEGLFVNSKVTLLNRRLAIIDRRGGDQPIYNEDESIVIIYVGEIYNFWDQREKLIKAGHIFKTKSDTEVIIHAYEEWGEKSFDMHNGMFTFALYDKKKDKLMLVRDHFGIKPLYYAAIPTSQDKIFPVPNSTRKTGFKQEAPQNSAFSMSLIFSSDLKPIIQSGLIKKKPNERILYRYLKFRVHDDQEETFFDGVNRLMPGEMLTIEKGKMRKEKYSTLEKDLEDLASKNIEGGLTSDMVDTFRTKLINTVRMRLISEVPVGTCLSGGLDSSTVVALANKLLQEKVKEAESIGKIQNTFSAVFPGSVNDEERYMDSVLEKVTNVQSHKVKPNVDEFFEKDLMDFLRTQEEPLISSGHYAQYKVMEEAHKKVTVLLDGQGSDEMMAGYLPYYFVYLRQLKKQGKYTTLLTEIFSSLDVVTKFGLMKLRAMAGMKKDVPASQVLNGGFASKFPSERYSPTSDNLKKRLIEDVFKNSVQCLLRYEDRNAMRFSIEGRVPFLDFNLIRYIFSLPDSAIIDRGWNKNILRKAMKGLLPDMIVNRRNKIGFTTPEHEWFMRMKNRIYSIFLSESFAKRPYFDQTATLSAFRQFIEGKNDDTLLFWRLLNVEMWLRIFFDPPLPEASEGQVKRESHKNYFDPNPGKSLERK